MTISVLFVLILIINIVESGSNTHEQGVVEPKYSSINEKYSKSITPWGEAQSAKIAVNFYSNPQLTARNYVLNNNDKVCVGDKIYAGNLNLGGEWFAKGGPIDSPPIEWLTKEQFEQVKTNIQNFNSTGDATPGPDIAGNSWDAPIPDTIMSREEALGMKIILYKSVLFNYPSMWAIAYAYGSLLCTANPQIISKNNQESFQITEEGAGSFEVKSSPECLFYLETVVFRRNPTVYPQTWKNVVKYMQYQRDVYSLLDYKTSIEPITKTINFEAVRQTDPPNLEVEDYSVTDAGIVRMIVTNTGSTDAQLDDIKSNYGFSISNKPLIKAGETKEVFGKLSDSNIDKDSITFNPVYRATELGCLSNKQFGETFVGGCVANSDCESGLCCVGKCRDATKGFCDDLNRDGTPDTWVVFETSN